MTLGEENWEPAKAKAEWLTANEVDAGLALVINMNHSVVSQEPPWDRKEVTYGKKGKDQEKEGVR